MACEFNYTTTENFAGAFGPPNNILTDSNQETDQIWLNFTDEDAVPTRTFNIDATSFSPYDSHTLETTRPRGNGIYKRSSYYVYFEWDATTTDGTTIIAQERIGAPTFNADYVWDGTNDCIIAGETAEERSDRRRLWVLGYNVSNKD